MRWHKWQTPPPSVRRASKRSSPPPSTKGTPPMDLHPMTATAKGPANTFSGDVYVNIIKQPNETSRLVAAMVRFTPGARSNWHSHLLGQTLHVTEGVGLVASRDGTVLVMRPGDTVWTPPGEEHWHGATDNNFMCHYALLEGTNDGDGTTWLEPVTDAQYNAAVTHQHLHWTSRQLTLDPGLRTDQEAPAPTAHLRR